MAVNTNSTNNPKYAPLHPVIIKAIIDAINRYVVYGANGIRGYYKEANRHSESVLIGRVGAQCRGGRVRQTAGGSRVWRVPPLYGYLPDRCNR